MFDTVKGEKPQFRWYNIIVFIHRIESSLVPLVSRGSLVHRCLRKNIFSCVNITYALAGKIKSEILC